MHDFFYSPHSATDEEFVLDGVTCLVYLAALLFVLVLIRVVLWVNGGGAKAP